MPKVLTVTPKAASDDAAWDKAGRDIIETEDKAAAFDEARAEVKSVTTSGAAHIDGDPSLNRVVVTRRFMGDHEFEPGEVIEIDDQRRRDVLERDRRVRPLAHGEEIWASVDKVLWVDKDQAEARSASLALV